MFHFYPAYLFTTLYLSTPSLKTSVFVNFRTHFLSGLKSGTKLSTSAKGIFFIKSSGSLFLKTIKFQASNFSHVNILFFNN